MLVLALQEDLPIIWELLQSTKGNGPDAICPAEQCPSLRAVPEAVYREGSKPRDQLLASVSWQ